MKKYVIDSLVCNINRREMDNLELSAKWEVGGWEGGDGAAIFGGKGTIHNNRDVVGAIASIASIASRW